MQGLFAKNYVYGIGGTCLARYYMKLLVAFLQSHLQMYLFPVRMRTEEMNGIAKGRQRPLTRSLHGLKRSPNRSQFHVEPAYS